MSCTCQQNNKKHEEIWKIWKVVQKLKQKGVSLRTRRNRETTKRKVPGRCFQPVNPEGQNRSEQTPNKQEKFVSMGHGFTNGSIQSSTEKQNEIAGPPVKSTNFSSIDQLYCQYINPIFLGIPICSQQDRIVWW
jgi:hypothetical protein